MIFPRLTPNSIHCKYSIVDPFLIPHVCAQRHVPEVVSNSYTLIIQTDIHPLCVHVRAPPSGEGHLQTLCLNHINQYAPTMFPCARTSMRRRSSPKRNSVKPSVKPSMPSPRCFPGAPAFKPPAWSVGFSKEVLSSPETRSDLSSRSPVHDKKSCRHTVLSHDNNLVMMKVTYHSIA